MTAPVEIEVKLRVADHAAVSDALHVAGAVVVERVEEVNAFLDDGSLHASDRGLRVRTAWVTPSDGGPPMRRATLTYKGPKRPGPFKQRVELESGLDRPDAAAALLKELGFAEVLRFLKQRTRWRLMGCTVELDTVEELGDAGNFVEVEGPTVQAIQAVRTRLGLDDAPEEPRSYAALVAEARGG